MYNFKKFTTVYYRAICVAIIPVDTINIPLFPNNFRGYFGNCVEKTPHICTGTHVVCRCCAAVPHTIQQRYYRQEETCECESAGRLKFTECQMYLVGNHKCFIEVVLDISRKTMVAQVRETVVSRCFERCLVYGRNNCSNRCCGLPGT